MTILTDILGLFLPSWSISTLIGGAIILIGVIIAISQISNVKFPSGGLLVLGVGVFIFVVGNFVQNLFNNPGYLIVVLAVVIAVVIIILSERSKAGRDPLF